MWFALFLLLLPFLTITVHADEAVSCFRQHSALPLPSFDLAPTTYHACFQVVKFVVRHERIELPLLFSRIPGVGYQLPEEWVYQTCALRLDMHSDTDEDTTTFKDIAVEAGKVMLACVAQSPHFGGTQYVGPKAVMNVTIFGVATDGPSALPLPAVTESIWNIPSQRNSVQE